MRARLDRPKLRGVEVVVVSDSSDGRALMLRDTEGISDGPVVVPGALAAVLGQFDGARTVEQIAREASRASGRLIDAAIVERLADELDAAFLLETPRFRARRVERVREFASSAVRPAWHAGGAYHGKPSELRRFIEHDCLAKAPPRASPGPLVGLCAPHIDLWRGAVGYGHAYGALGRALSERVDTVVLLGTSHAAMRRPFAVCDKIFETPLGPLEPDRAAVNELVRASRFDPREDEYLHRSEHSLEFQAVFLRHALGPREARIVPILCGLGEAQNRGRDPSLDGDAESFLVALGEFVERCGDRVLVIAGADLAHVGPRLGDPEALDEGGREALERRDLESVGRAARRDESGFFEHAVEDLATRRVCGVGPIYTMLRVLRRDARGELLHYTQCVDPDEGSIVSHASLAFTA